MKRFCTGAFLCLMLMAALCPKVHAAAVSDYEAIHYLVACERLYRSDQRDAELAACYAEDAQIRTSWQRGGVDSFVGKAPVERRQAARPVISRCNPPVIHLSKSSDAKALVEYPVTAVRSVAVHGVEAVLTSYMRLVYRIEKRGGEWKITVMTTVNERDDLAPAIPGQDLRIDPEDLKTLRPSYRWLTYTRLLAGGDVKNDELGTDRPDELREFYKAEFAWLNETRH